ncbi:MAG TPA: hypothetical protein VGW30_04535 [Gaiellaceae bacterium]|nr:hypothetical protein [Gaiellaceae bacterium]
MSTPDQPTQQHAPPPPRSGGMTIDVARLPIPGNAEFALYLLALIVAWIVAWTTDSLTANSWYQFFLFTTVAYILSRGIAKASRVLEQ